MAVEKHLTYSAEFTTAILVTIKVVFMCLIDND